MKKLWCGYHKRLESIKNFHKNSCSPTGYMNCCKSVQIQRVTNWHNSNIDYRRATARVYSEHRRGKITFSQRKVKLNILKKEYNI